MDTVEFRRWLAAIENLTPAQREKAKEAIQGAPPSTRVKETIESRIDEERLCPHCQTPGAVLRGQANGLRRFRCKGCGKSFNALTGTPLARLRHRDRWLDFADCLRGGDTVRGSAVNCDIAKTTSFRWRHRFLKNAVILSRKLSGIVEADETFFLQSNKGERTLERPARHRGGKATKRGLSKEQVPVLIAADRSGNTICSTLPELNSEQITAVLEPVLAKDALLVTDGGTYYPKAAERLGVNHEDIIVSAGERVRGELHIQTVNSRHERLKAFIRTFRGIGSKYLPNYLRWFHISILPKTPTPQTCLNAALALPA